MMTFFGRSSVVARTLLQIGAAVTLILIATTAIVYGTMLKGIESQVLKTLSGYSLERAKRETLLFSQGEESLRMMKEQFLSLLATSADNPARFDASIARDADGALRSRRESVDPQRQASAWIAANTAITPDLRRMVLASSDITERFFPAWSPQFVSLYISSPLGYNTGIAPTEPNWVWSLPSDYDQNSFDWYREATPEHNPARQAVWTRLLADEVDEEHGDTAYVTLSQPVDIDGRHIATLHLDLDLAGLMERTIRSERPGLEHLVVRSDGQLIASPQVSKDILKRGDFYLGKATNSPLRSVFESVTSHVNLPWVGYDPKSDYYIAASRMAGPDWLFISLLKGSDLRQQAFASAKWILWVGLASLTVVLFVLSRILNRQIALPLHQFLGMTQRMGMGETGVRVEWQARDELGVLASAFNQMASSISERDASLHALNQELEERIAARTESLRQSEERFSRAFHGSHALLAIIDVTSGWFLDVNAAFLNTLGFSRDDILGSDKPQPSIIPEAFRKRCMKEGNVRDSETILLTQFGENRIVLLSGDRVTIGSADCLLVAGSDITARKQVEAEILRALDREKELNDLKSKFVSMVSHEFRTPLEMILSSTEILSRYLPRLTPEQRDKRLETIQIAVRRMASMMEQILLLGRFDASRTTCRREEIQLESWCQQLVKDAFDFSSEPRDIQLTLTDAPTIVYADEALLSHIFTNLLSNALKYSAPDQPVNFRVTRDGGDVVFEVNDLGIGIPEVDHSQLFQDFHRGSNVGTRSGTGMGLVVVKRCIELHHGSICFQSTPDSGTTFIVRLPIIGTDEKDLGY